MRKPKEKEKAWKEPDNSRRKQPERGPKHLTVSRSIVQKRKKRVVKTIANKMAR